MRSDVVDSRAEPHEVAVVGSTRTAGGGRLREAFRTKLFRDTSWTMFTELAGMVSQLATLLLISRAFDKPTYGLFVGTIAFMNVISPFTTLGMGYVLVQRVAGDGADPHVETGRAWATIALGGLFGTAFVLITSRLIVPDVPVRVLLALAFGELIFTQLTYAGRFCAQAVERPASGAQVVATVWLLRLVAAGAYLLVVPRPTLAGWAYFHMTASLLGAILTYVVLNRLLALRPRASLARAKDVRQGMAFSLTIGAVYLKNDADKTLLLTFHKTEAAGLYGLAYRVIVPLHAPVRALADSTFARFFKEGAQSSVDTFRLAVRTTVVGVVMTAAGGLVIAAGAPLLPRMLGEKWQPAVIIVQLLACVPTLIAMQIYAFNALMGLGRRRACMAVTVASSIINIAMNIARIPRFDWKGSTAATFVAELISVLALWTLLWKETHVPSTGHRA